MGQRTSPAPVSAAATTKLPCPRSGLPKPNHGVAQDGIGASAHGLDGLIHPHSVVSKQAQLSSWVSVHHGLRQILAVEADVAVNLS